ncbi:NADH-quinone oxidoreductase subunit N [Acetobacter tropicalis]|uniref:NADH-quinone oxidoreductase subunit N n=1 Tax=Acetobacter tropicalis TaxID=104102 RepID=A0A252ACN6_9PROT|nr:NADH-quinone oxidoreductase subunit N [Acetobacter tropicalis]OUI87340.1 NADH-quinone oxidoreductase [Acetobacter tropicalis]
MIAHDLFLPLPLPILSLGTMLLLGSIAWRRSLTRSLAIGFFTLVLALGSLNYHLGSPQVEGASLFVQDRWGNYTALLILLSSLCILLMSWRDLHHDKTHPMDEYPLLLVLGTLGAITMVFSTNYLPFFLGVEIQALSLMGLVASRPYYFAQATEASMKYLILSGVSSAILLFGIGLAYATTGSLYFSPPPASPDNTIPAIATIMILVGVFFKLSAVPFHMWLPDVMEGSPPPVAAFMAVVSKIAIFSSLVRYFGTEETPVYLHGILFTIIILTILGGNILALRQTNLIRLLAYSSIAHVGYLLIAFFSPGQLRSEAITLYLAAYAASTLGIFAIICAFSWAENSNGSHIPEWKGLFYTRPFLATTLSLMLLSLAGIPPGIGFFAKFEVAATGVERQQTLLLATLVVGSIIGLYYYLYVIRTLMGAQNTPSLPAKEGHSPELTTLIVVLTLIVVVGGIFPARMIPQVLPSPTSPQNGLINDPVHEPENS